MRSVLAVDIGNTRTTLGIFYGKRLDQLFDVPTGALSQRGRGTKQLERFLKTVSNAPRPLWGVVISSVVPTGTNMLSSIVKRHLRLSPLVVSRKVHTGLRFRYSKPGTLGADRICSAVAAHEKYGGPVIVVDAGTATTFGVVSRDGTFLGGAIAPGISTAASALHRQTARLPLVELKFPDSPIGTTTVRNIQSGVLFGAVDAIEGMIRRLKAVSGKRTKVILTGGFSRLLSPNAQGIDAVEPYLVLEGARMIFERERGGEPDRFPF